MTNIAEILKDCPKGTKLYSPLCGECYFDSLNYGTIICTKQNTQKITFTSEGYYMLPVFDDSEPVLFPSKENRDWSTFQRPFKDGDILATDLGSVFYLNTCLNTDEYYGCYVGIGGDGSFHICEPFAYKECCGLATQEEKQKLFKEIKERGYKWNPETKTLEELVEPRFKVGDRIKAICNNNQYDIKELTDTHYTLVEVEYKFKYTEPISEDKKWELVPNKFDINTLKPFDKVLVRDFDNTPWEIDFFSRLLDGKHFKCVDLSYVQCIPYKDNEHLLGTTDNCENFYKNW